MIVLKAMNFIKETPKFWSFVENQFLPEAIKERDTLITWKERAIYLSFLCVIVFGFIALIPSLILAYQKDLMAVFYLDIVAYAAAVFFFVSQKFSLKIKSWITVAAIYLLGITLLVKTGYYGAGYIWLFGVSMLAALLIKGRYAVFVLLFNLLILFSIGGYVLLGLSSWHYLLEDPMEIWVILTVNFMAVNALVILVTARVRKNIDEATVRQINAQNNLIEEKKFSDFIIRTIPGFFFLFEQQKDGRMLLKRWNENLAFVLGYTVEDLEDMDSFQLFEEKNYGFIKKKRQQLFDEGIVGYEIELLKKDKTPLPVFIQAYSFNKNDKIYIVGTAIDISDRVKEAKEKERMQKSLAASEKNCALGTLSSGIAHDFNNILSSITGHAQLIRMAPNDPDNVEKGVNQILKGSGRAKELVQQILTFSRQAESEKRTMKPHLIVKEAVKFMRSSIPPSIEIKEKIETRQSIHADATQIHQVMMNLCTNAYHAMREMGGGILSVELKEIQIADENHIEGYVFIPGKYLLLKIGDTGSGMDKATIERIFEPYFTTKNSGEGTGLGLAVVQGIIKDHHGHIRAESKIGEGSSFELYFPVINETEKQTAPKGPVRIPVPTQNSEKIMIVDDEISLQSFMQRVLDDYGYHTEAFSNGEDALEKFVENPDFFDLIITDIAMPKMTGDILVKKLLAVRKDIPIIVHTGLTDDFDEEAAYKAGVKKYFQKPIDTKDLLLASQDILNP